VRVRACRYTGHEYDSEFIAVLRQECHKYIKREKRATLGALRSSSHRHASRLLALRTHTHASTPPRAADMMCDFVRNTKLSKVELGVEEVLQIVNTLVYDGKVDAHESRRDNGAPYTEGTVFYTPAALPLQEHSDFTLVPCGICPVAGECHEGGIISPATCVYYDSWLRFDDAGGGGGGAGPMQT
jgi:DNA-directed RNA polymerase III subunit RPC6